MDKNKVQEYCFYCQNKIESVHNYCSNCGDFIVKKNFQFKNENIEHYYYESFLDNKLKYDLIEMKKIIINKNNEINKLKFEFNLFNFCILVIFFIFAFKYFQLN
tara:strand:+ start:643 stop:954 length:312 start_codon:yes stop_codon:yes gene_type:complete